MALSLITAPTAYPLTLAQVKAQCQISPDDTRQDTWLQEVVIPAVTDRCQAATNRQLLTATYDLSLDACPGDGWLELPSPPLQSVTHVKYLDLGGTLTTLVQGTDYVVDAPAGPRCRRGRVALASGKTWPTILDQINAVVVRFVAGYGATDEAIPDLLRQAMLIDAATLVLFREDVIAGAVVSMPRTAASIYWSCRSHQTRAAA